LEPDVHQKATTEHQSKFKVFWQVILGERMTPEAHLVKTRWFRMAIAGPIAIAVAVSLVFTLDTSLDWNLTPEGMNAFLNLFKLPIGIAGLALPLAAVVAANHRSMQTAKQILEQNSQNIFSNHLEHRRYFGNFIDERKPFKGAKIEVAALYEMLFPNAVEGDLTPQHSLLKLTLESISRAISFMKNAVLSEISKENFILSNETLKNLESEIASMERNVALLITPIERAKRDDLLSDQVKFIRETTNRYRTIGLGLEKCANFHRYLFETELIQKIDFDSTVIEKEIHDFIDEYGLYKSFENAISEYLDSHGSLKQQGADGVERFRRRILDIKENLELNNKDISVVKTVLENHLPVRASLSILTHAPEDWKNNVSLKAKY
jgi:hypothetical protein